MRNMEKGRTLLSQAVAYRTYTRVASDGRVERWEDVARRVAEFSASLAPVEPGEKEALYNLILERAAFPAGRTLWVGGTPMGWRGETSYNCAYHRIRGPEDLRDLQLLLMSGAGVGNSIRDEDVEEFNRSVPVGRILGKTLTLREGWVGYSSPEYRERTEVYLDDGEATIIVGDSREGWAQALYFFLVAISDNTPAQQVIVDLRSVRPYGEKLKAFGGFASGPGPLRELFTTIFRRLQGEALENGGRGRWTPILLLDLVNLVGQATVAGGTRRSAESVLFVPGSPIATAKVGPWWEHAPWRAQSNNSAVFDERPSLETIREYVHYAMEYGEPGFVNGEAARRRRPDWDGLNPCFEILLRDHGVCNLATLVLPAFLGRPMAEIERAARLLARHAVRITFLPFSPLLRHWQKVQEGDRLIGISMTGWVDFWAAQGKLHDTAAQVAFLERLRAAIHRAAEEYAKELGIPVPLLKTTIKPEGTLSLVAGGVSPGIHDPYAPYYIRRVRMSRNDYVAQALYYLGMEPKPELGYSTLEDSPVWVYEFPLRSPSGRAAISVPAVEQLERYRMMMRHYVDHNASITVYVGRDEVEDVVRWIYDNWDDVVAVSLLPKDGGGYTLAPLEEIGEAQYREMEAALPDPSSLHSYVQAAVDAGAKEASPEDDPSCVSGACPVR
ncbi:ribonucleoside-triphosphate reductase [Thermus phage MN1]|nr:ribonucleoside-triphosphate reductase [Thermus phage MN1]